MKIFIPIKQNSQRVPNKNFRNFGGTPLYKHTIKKLSNFDVFIDTDSKKLIKQIKNDPELKNVIVYLREESLCGDDVSVADLINNFINKYKINNETIAQVHVTSPFLKAKTLLSANEKMGDYDSVVSCNKVQTRFWRKEKYGMCPVNHNPVVLQQTQDLTPFYEENSLFYIFNSNNFLKTQSRVGKNPYFFETRFPENIDIDWEYDWELAECLIRK